MQNDAGNDKTESSTPPLKSRTPTICIAENRLSCEPGIRLLVASLTKHNPTLAIELFFPGAPVTFAQWLAEFPQVRLNAYEITGTWLAYNVKAQAMLHLIEGGCTDVLWIDSDIIVNGDISTIYTDLATETMIVAEEAMCSAHFDGDAMRARSWGLPVGRQMPFQLNSGIIGASTHHISFLQRWRAALDSPEFKHAFHLSWDKRPIHFMGDQEVLTALLCSSEFSQIPLRFLMRGAHVIQYFGPAGYTVSERLHHLFKGPPVFIHSQGHKVWQPYPAGSGLRDRIMRHYQRSNPYRIAAREYRKQLVDDSWLGPDQERAATSRGSKWLEAPLSGFATAALMDILRYARWLHTGGEPRRVLKAD